MRRAVTYEGVEYAPGARFRVIANGCTLDGMKPWEGQSSAWEGWRQPLQIGDTLTCEGFGPGFGSDPGYGVEWSTEQSRSVTAVHCEFRPMTGGMWAYRPAPGYLERIT